MSIPHSAAERRSLRFVDGRHGGGEIRPVATSLSNAVVTLAFIPVVVRVGARFEAQPPAGCFADVPTSLVWLRSGGGVAVVGARPAVTAFSAVGQSVKCTLRLEPLAGSCVFEGGTPRLLVGRDGLGEVAAGDAASVASPPDSDPIRIGRQARRPPAASGGVFHVCVRVCAMSWASGSVDQQACVPSGSWGRGVGGGV